MSPILVAGWVEDLNTVGWLGIFGYFISFLGACAAGIAAWVSIQTRRDQREAELRLQPQEEQLLRDLVAADSQARAMGKERYFMLVNGRNGQEVVYPGVTQLPTSHAGLTTLVDAGLVIKDKSYYVSPAGHGYVERLTRQPSWQFWKR